jgi:hypothetical protein
MMTYRFKVNQEAVWFVLVAAGTVILQALATLDVDKIVDWRTWAVGLLVASIRAGAGAALSLLTAPPSARANPADTTPTPSAVLEAIAAMDGDDLRAVKDVAMARHVALEAARQPVGLEGRG